MASALMDDQEQVLNLTRQHLKKVEPSPGNVHHSALLVDHNEISRLDNVETYCSLTKFSASHNQLIRMYGVARLYSLRVLNLSHNSIVSIEGLKDLKYLAQLNLAGNNIKNVEHLNSNLMLEVLDLSDNAIGSIPDLSHLSRLRKLHLANNRIKTLQFCDKFLPATLMSLTLADNGLTDLNEVSRLYHLVALEVFSISGNPCCMAPAQLDLPVEFFRPFVINWLPGLKVLDEWPVGPKENLAAEWLYSLGRGRQFKPGQQDELLAYLASIRPELATKDPEDEVTSSKMDKILTLAQQHQQTLLAAAAAANPSPTPARKVLPRRNPIPLRSQKQSTPPPSSSGMSNSSTFTAIPAGNTTKAGEECDLLSAEPMPALMAQSLDPASAHVALERSVSQSAVGTNSRPSRPVSASHYDYEGTESVGLRRSGSSAGGARKPLVQTSRPGSSSRPASGTKQPASKLPVLNNNTEDRSRSSSNRNGIKACPASSTARQVAGPSSRSTPEELKAAVTIQKVWRGYQVRNLDPVVRRIKSDLRAGRTEQHVTELARQLAETKMQQTNGCLPSDSALKDTVARLQQDVLDLQQSMQQVLDWIGHHPVARPRTLALKQPEEQQVPGAPQPQHPVETFAQGMASRLIRQSVSGELDEPSAETS